MDLRAQVAVEADLPRFDPFEDAAVFAERLVPLPRSGAAERDDHDGAPGA